MLFTRPLGRLARRSLIVLTIGAAGVLPSSVVHAAIPSANENGSITLYGKKGNITDPENDSNASCTINVLPAGSSRTVDVLLNNPASECYGLRVASISMENMPPATQVLLTDDYLCDTTLGSSFERERDPSTNKNFWVKLKTGAAGATLVEESISALNFKGFASNRSPSGDQVSEEVKVEDFGVSGTTERMTYTLSCVRITTSTNKTTKIGTYYSVPATAWSSAVKESASRKWQCPEGQVMTGRKHKGDENADTQYKCTSIKDVNTKPSAWSPMFRECGVRLDAKFDDDKNRYKTCNELVRDNNWNNTDYYYFTCPVDQVMIGRGHGYSNPSDWPEDDTGDDKGDDNGRTDYRCAELYQGAPSESTRVTVLPGKWSTPNTESGKENNDHGYPEHNGESECPLNQVMVGRAHRGDENNLTRYLCARLRSPASN
ncbi:hypothetical protein [Pseudomonas putida]|uniref:hypothetical protein n=1 Tax=Pseudomonas putida TaxID=303 RepID=UPI0009A22AA9|nr:hypothetical protein [Pseudomonas putida]